MNNAEPAPGPKQNDWPEWVQKWVIPYVKEELMWPVIFALWSHFVMAMAVVLAFGWRENVFLGAALVFLLLSGSGRLVWFEIQVIRRPGWIFLFLVVSWVAATIVAYLGAQYDLI